MEDGKGPGCTGFGQNCVRRERLGAMVDDDGARSKRLRDRLKSCVLDGHVMIVIRIALTRIVLKGLLNFIFVLRNVTHFTD